MKNILSDLVKFANILNHNRNAKVLILKVKKLSSINTNYAPTAIIPSIST